MRLKELDRLKSDFVSVVSHELRSPLAMVRESVAQVTEGMHGEITDNQKRFLFMAVNNIDRLARIISDLLDISRIESGRINLHKDFYDLMDLMENSLFLFDPQIKEKNLQIIREYSADSARVAYVDKDRMTQVFNNLIENAVKFTEKGHIKVWIHCTKNIVECAVVDTGVGIAEENMPKVFNKFEQFTRSAGSGAKGTGLGLSIVKGMVELHSGSVWAESKLGEGSAFGFRIPIYNPSDFAQECLTRGIQKASIEGSPLSIIVFTIKNMEEFSKKTTEGFAMTLHHMAENVLRNSIQHVSDICAKDDRTFLVFLPGLDRREVLSTASKSKYVLEDYFKIELKDFKVHIDFKVVNFPEDGKTEEEIKEKISV
ncbi:HAMP domain-containing histidine kinase [bacterium]|nr:MAG: HAMP domain-containing histidine kinase [bacterium]